MFQLQVDYGSCGGECRDCKFSRPSSISTDHLQFSSAQKSVIDRVVSIFGQKRHQEASLSIPQCLSTFTDESDFVDTGDLPVTELALYVKLSTARVDDVVRGVDIFLARYPLAHRVLFSFARGFKNLHLQRNMLREMIPGLLNILNGKEQIRTFGFAFGANDILDMRSFTPLHRDFSQISAGSHQHPVVDALQTIHACKVDDIIVTSRDGLEKFKRRAIRFDLPEGRKFGLGLYREKNIPRSLDVMDAVKIMGDTPEPNFHVSPTHTFLYHHPLLARIPGIQVKHEEAHELLDFYEKGNPWPQLVQGSILKHSGFFS